MQNEAKTAIISIELYSNAIGGSVCLFQEENRMKIFKKRLILCVIMLLLFALVLPAFSGCALIKKVAKKGDDGGKEAVSEEKETTSTKEKEETKVPQVTQSDPNAPSLESTPNKGGNAQLTSGGPATISVYSQMIEDLKRQQELLPQIYANNVAERRALVEAQMRAMLSVKWSPKTDLTYSPKTNSISTSDATYNSTRLDYSPNVVYQGLPYSQGTSNLDQFLIHTDSVDENGIPVMNLDYRALYYNHDYARLGADDFDMLIWAWSYAGNNALCWYQEDAIPSRGFLYLGGLDMTAEVADKSLANDTDNICAKNGEEKLYKAYALLQKGDGLFRMDERATTAMMVVSVDVKKNPDGSINPDQSKVVYLRQTRDNLDSGKIAQAGAYSYKDGSKKDLVVIGDIDKEMTFAQLFNNSFLPVTFKELNDGTPLPKGAAVSTGRYKDALKAATYNNDILYNGFMVTTRRAVFYNIVITDENGTEIQNSLHSTIPTDICNGGIQRQGINLAKALTANYTSGGGFLLKGEVLNIATLEAGESYRYVINVTYVTGETSVALDVPFTMPE